MERESGSSPPVGALTSPSAAARRAETTALPGVGYVAGLDGLRAVAIMLVLLFHACALSGLAGWARGGFLGVSLFFTLSGFLITSLLVREHDASGQVLLRRFWSRRARRLLPASLTVVAAVVVLSQVHGSGLGALHLADAVAAIWSFTNWHVVASGEQQLLHTIVGPLGPYWSLAVEEQFYVVLAVAFLAVQRLRRPVPTLAVLLGTVWFGSAVIAATTRGPQYRLEFGTDTRAAELAAGALLALALHRWPALVAANRRGLDMLGAVALTVVVVMAFVVDYRPPWLLRGGYAGVSLLAVLVVAGILARQRLEQLLSARPLVFLGRTSYSLYLVHWPVILVLPESRTHLHGWANVGLTIAVALLVAGVLHAAVEQPLRRARADPAQVLVISLAGALAVTGLAWTVLR